MDFQRQEYPALLTSLQPGQAASVLSDRISYIGRINSDIAEWLSERRRIEDNYAQNLRKLAGRRIDGIKSLGVFQTPWQNLIHSCEGLAEAHHTFAQRIASDVEKPLQEYHSKSREMTAVTTVQGNLNALARDFDEAQKKADKLAGKKGKGDGTKVALALSSVQEASQQWESQAPYIFEQLQALDEHRVNHLRDVLTQLQTHEMDQLEKSRGVAEIVLNALLSVNTADEISTFVAMTSEGVPSLTAPRRASRPATSSAAAPPLDPPTPTPANLDGNSGLAPPPVPAADDRRSEISAASGSARTPAEKPKKSGFGGLKRLGTVRFGRNKDKDKENKSPEQVMTPEKKSRMSRNPLRRGNSSSRDMHQIPSPNASMTELADTSSRQETPTPRNQRRLSEPPPALQPSIQRTPDGANIPAVPRVNPALTNGTQQTTGSSQELSAGSPALLSEAPREAAPSSEFASSALDDITRAQQEAAAENEQQQFKLDIRSEPIKEEDSEAQKALSDVANALRAQAQPPSRKTGTLRGRRDVRNTIFVPSPPTPESLPVPESTATSSSPFPTPSKSSAGDPGGDPSGDAQSIRSQHSMSSLGAPAGAIKHPEMPAPGLHASVIETVSAWFERGEVARSVVIGELALAHNPPTGGGASPRRQAHVRLDRFPVLEKVAPNPTFVHPLPGRAGEYRVDLAAAARAQVAFKYQVHLEAPARAAHAPVILNPSWKAEAAQISVILNYAPNPAFAFPPSADAAARSLQNVVVVIGIEGAKASACQSKPVGTFSRERGMIHWRLGDLSLEPPPAGAASQQRLLARFTTEGTARPGSVEARWEMGGGVGSGLGMSVAAEPAEEEEGREDPFADAKGGEREEGWREVGVLRKLVSGKYIAN